MRIYLAGPMRGIPEFNFPAFNDAAAKLRAEGHEVFNPAEKDCERHGTDISAGNATGDEKMANVQHGFDLRVALGDDLSWICSQAEAIALLPGWETSKGATAERAAAIALGLPVIPLVGVRDASYNTEIKRVAISTVLGNSRVDPDELKLSLGEGCRFVILGDDACECPNCRSYPEN